MGGACRSARSFSVAPKSQRPRVHKEWWLGGYLVPPWPKSATILIDEREFRRYEARIQSQHRSLAQGVEKHREHLMSLIDIKLMVREAYARGLDKNPAWIKAVDLARHKAMVEAYIREQVGLQIEISEDELRDKFAAHPARHAVRGAHILLDNRARADSIYAEIEGRSEPPLRTWRASTRWTRRPRPMEAGSIRTMPSIGSQIECTIACSH